MRRLATGHPREVKVRADSCLSRILYGCLEHSGRTSLSLMVTRGSSSMPNAGLLAASRSSSRRRFLGPHSHTIGSTMGADRNCALPRGLEADGPVRPFKDIAFRLTRWVTWSPDISMATPTKFGTIFGKRRLTPCAPLGLMVGKTTSDHRALRRWMFFLERFTSSQVGAGMRGAIMRALCWRGKGDVRLDNQATPCFSSSQTGWVASGRC
jgi:hypothetical protein